MIARDALIQECQRLLKDITPGEWSARYVNYSKNEDVSFEVCTKNARLKLVVQTIMREVATEAEDIVRDRANVTFIAAAPRLIRDLLTLIQNEKEGDLSRVDGERRAAGPTGSTASAD